MKPLLLSLNDDLCLRIKELNSDINSKNKKLILYKEKSLLEHKIKNDNLGRKIKALYKENIPIDYISPAYCKIVKDKKILDHLVILLHTNKGTIVLDNLTDDLLYWRVCESDNMPYIWNKFVDYNNNKMVKVNGRL